MDVNLFDFDLPETSIALFPADPRDSARLLEVSPRGQLIDHHVSDLPARLRAGDVLVLNETRVIPAALKGIRPARAHGGGGYVTIDVNLLERLAPDQWLAFARPAKRLKPGDQLSIGDSLSATVLEKFNDGQAVLKFDQSGDALDRAIAQVGEPPLPPYIARKRALTAEDKAHYQTVFAAHDGSVAAPTAGLHFTPDLLEKLNAAGVQIEKVTLHVGAGTFLPVKSDDTDDHDMHSEWYEIDPATAARINAAKAEGRRIIAVGTTALRALESAVDDAGQLVALSKDTRIFIQPGYNFKIIDGLMTNFHLPKSTLFMLVSALVGRETMLRAYQHAIETGYRFYSYGDSSLLWAAEA